MVEVTITVTTMGFGVPITKDGLIIGTNLHIGRFASKFEHWEFDKKLNREVLINEYFYFDMTNNVVHFPKYALDDFKSYLSSRDIKFNVIEDKGVSGKEVEFLMLPHVNYKNDKQKGAIEYLTNTNSGPLRGLALQTGEGKSISHIWALQKLGVRSVTTMTSRLEQWVSVIKSYTNLEDDDIYIIQGSASLTKLFEQVDKTIFPKIILASTKTIRLYLDYGEGYKHLPHPTEFCEKIGIGVIGTDEYHEHFNTNLMMMLAFNPKIFIPITATFVASSPYVKSIFNNFIPKSVQFEGGEYNRFVDATAYRYISGGHILKPYHYMRAKGYSQNKFEEFLLSKKGEVVLNALLNDAIIPIIKEHYIKIAEKGEKFLMICSSKEFCDYLAKVFKRTFDKTVSVFYSGMPTSTLDRFDMILSTPGSAGTGRDIAGLRTCFAFENTGSEVRNLQFIGRLRGPPQMMNTPHYVMLYFACIPQHVQYNNSRAMLLGQRALTYRQRTIG